MTPEQAATYARQWEQVARTARSQHEHSSALASAAGWWREHARLSATAVRAPAPHVAHATHHAPQRPSEAA